MNKLLLLLLIPFVSFGQDFDFHDIKQIDSEKQFKKVMFEKEFVKLEERTFLLNRYISYAWNYNESNEQAQIWAEFEVRDEKMSFQFSRNYDNTPNTVYKRIFEQVKRECTFYDFYNTYGDGSGDEYACYTCPNSKYKGKIGFNRGNDGSDYIETFNFE